MLDKRMIENYYQAIMIATDSIGTDAFETYGMLLKAATITFLENLTELQEDLKEFQEQRQRVDEAYQQSLSMSLEGCHDSECLFTIPSKGQQYTNGRCTCLDGLLTKAQKIHLRTHVGPYYAVLARAEADRCWRVMKENTQKVADAARKGMSQ